VIGRGPQLLHATRDLFARAVQQDRTPDHDHVAKTQNAQLNVFAVHLRAVGALKIGEHQAAVVFLNLDMEATNSIIIELNRVAFLAPDQPVRRGPLPKTGLVTQSEDVVVDARGNIYVSDKNHGVYILRHTPER
jgi:hypothetical protein